jgi:uncharacterized membrane protein (UPF0136 family)
MVSKTCGCKQLGRQLHHITRAKSKEQANSNSPVREPRHHRPHPRRPHRRRRYHGLCAHWIHSLHCSGCDGWRSCTSPCPTSPYPTSVTLSSTLPSNYTHTSSLFPQLTTTAHQYILGGLRIRNGQPYGVELGLLASIVLAGSSMPRAIKTGKPLPIGLSLLAAYGLFAFGSAFSTRVR